MDRMSPHMNNVLRYGALMAAAGLLGGGALLGSAVSDLSPTVAVAAAITALLSVARGLVAMEASAHGRSADAYARQQGTFLLVTFGIVLGGFAAGVIV